MSVNIQSGLINKVAVTPANVTDAEEMVHVLSNSGVIYADKVRNLSFNILIISNDDR